MKKLFFIVTLCTITCISFFTSCSKDSSSQTEDIQNVESDLSTETDEFEEALIFGISLLNENESILIFKTEGKYDWDVIEHVTSQNQTSRRANNCQNSNAVTFAKCVKAQVDANKCVTVGSIDGQYWNDVVDCPRS